MDYRQEDELYFIRLDKGENLIKCLTTLAHEEDWHSGSLTGIGALKNIELGFYHLKDQDYQRRIVEEESELISLTGNLSTLDDEPFFHLHAVLGRDDYSTFGGHLFAAEVAVTCEIYFQHFEQHIVRRFDSKIGLNLIRFEE